MLDKILKKINADFLTESVTKEITEAFDSAVSSKVEEFKKTAMVSETEKILDLYDAKLDEFKSQIVEAKDAELESYKTNLVESLDSYLELVVEEYLKENKIAIEKEVASKKAEAILEAFDTVLVSAAVDVKTIVEAKTSKTDGKVVTATAKIEEMEARLNKVLDENKNLKVKNDDLLVLGLKTEVSEGLTLVQRERFEKLAKLVGVSENKVDYLNKLEAIKESILSEKSPAKVEQVSESTKSKQVPINESKQSAVKVDSSRFF